MIENQKNVIDGVMSWWSAIRPNNGYDPYKGDRAEIRRCHSTSDVMFVSAYHLLLEKTNANREDPVELQSLATVARVLSWISEEVNRPFAEQLATNDPQFQSVRFRRLLETTEWDELGVQLVRALQFTKRKGNPADLAKSIMTWNHGSYVKEHWALDYYRHAKNEKKE